MFKLGSFLMNIHFLILAMNDDWIFPVFMTASHGTISIWCVSWFKGSITWFTMSYWIFYISLTLTRMRAILSICIIAFECLVTYLANILSQNPIPPLTRSIKSSNNLLISFGRRDFEIVGAIIFILDKTYGDRRNKSRNRKAEEVHINRQLPID